MIGQADIAAYRDQGYIVVEKVFDEAALDQLRRVTDSLLDRARLVTASNADYDIGPGHRPDRPVVRRIKDPHRQHPVYDAALRSPRLLDILEGLIGPDIRFDHSKLNFKPSGGRASVEWHQDWAFYPHSNDDILAVGVMLEDCTLENGPLMVMPGSHKGPIYDHHNQGWFAGAIDPKASGLDFSRAVPLTAPAGSCSFHHVRMLHGSTENRSDRNRPLLLFSYAAVDAWPLVDRFELEEFDSRILRGAPTLQPRQESLPIRLPLPRHSANDSIYDDQESVAGRSFDTPALKAT